MTNLLSEKAVLAGLTIGGWSARKLDRKVTKETNERHNAASDAGRYNKALIEPSEMKKLTQAMSAARIKHYTLTQPWLDDGARILPTALYDNYRTEIGKLRREYFYEVDQFVKRYPKLVADAPKRLNGMFDPNDFPGVDAIREKFLFEQKLFPCPDVSDFRISIAKEQLEDIKSDLDTKMKEALHNAMNEPVRRIIDVTSRMADRMKAYTPGEREGNFQSSVVTNIRELVEILPAFNLTGDKAITELTKRLATICVDDADALKSSPKLRKSVGAEAEAILKQAEALMA